MEREIHVERTEDPVRPAGEPRTSEEARRAVEETRDRISRDLDAIEHRIETKKGEILSKKDRIEEKTEEVKARAKERLQPVKEQVRTRPLPAIAAAMGAGLVLGVIRSLWHDRKEHREERVLSSEERSELRRLREDMERLRDDQKELLRAAKSKRHSASPSGTRRKSGGLENFGHQLGGMIAGAIASGIKDRVSGAFSGRSRDAVHTGTRSQVIDTPRPEPTDGRVIEPIERRR